MAENSRCDEETVKKNDEQGTASVCETEEQHRNNVNDVFFEKSQSLVDIANNTFKELCKTLEKEQTKLMELEERRKRLQEEMQRLKKEIEDEKQNYRLTMLETDPENAEALKMAIGIGTDDAEEDEDEDEDDIEEGDTSAVILAIEEEEQGLNNEKLETCFETDELEIDDSQHSNVLEQSTFNSFANIEDTSKSN